jgi:hypothetical protein
LKKPESKRPGKVLFIFGQGPLAAQGIHLVALFSRAGFNTCAAVLNPAKPWIGTEALTHVARSSVITPETVSAYGWNSGGFDLCIGLGLPVTTLAELVLQVAAAPFLQPLTRGQSVWLLHDPRANPSEALTFELAERGFLQSTLSEEWGRLQDDLEKIFATMMNQIRGRYTCARFHAALNWTVPPELQAVTGPAPAWVAAFGRQLTLAGLTRKADRPPDLCIEAFAGPWPNLSTTKKKKDELRFALEAFPERPDALPTAALTIQCAHPELPVELLQEQAAANSWFLQRKTTGDCVVIQPDAVRVLPCLEESAVLARLTTLLVDRLKLSPGSDTTN